MDSDNQRAVLDEHRRLMVISGKFSDFQIKNLEMYPQIVFDGIKNMTIDYDVSTKKGSGYVHYTIKMGKKPDDIEQRIKDIEAWVKDLLFKEIEVKVKVTCGRAKSPNKGRE